MGKDSKLKFVIYSFGYKYGPPSDVNLLIDVRMLPNPYWEETLRPFTGKEKAVADYVLESASGKEFISYLMPLCDFFLRENIAKQSHSWTIAIGCTGGRHRSVAIVEQLAQQFSGANLEVITFHRDIDKDSQRQA